MSTINLNRTQYCQLCGSPKDRDLGQAVCGTCERGKIGSRYTNKKHALRQEELERIKERYYTPLEKEEDE